MCAYTSNWHIKFNCITSIAISFVDSQFYSFSPLPPTNLKNFSKRFLEHTKKLIWRHRNTSALRRLYKELFSAHWKSKHSNRWRLAQLNALVRCHVTCVKNAQGMQANFEMFSKLMEEQLAEQRRKFEEELKKMEPVSEEKSLMYIQPLQAFLSYFSPNPHSMHLFCCLLFHLNT